MHCPIHRHGILQGARRNAGRQGALLAHLLGPVHGGSHQLARPAPAQRKGVQVSHCSATCLRLHCTVLTSGKHVQANGSCCRLPASGPTHHVAQKSTRTGTSDCKQENEGVSLRATARRVRQAASGKAGAALGLLGGVHALTCRLPSRVGPPLTLSTSVSKFFMLTSITHTIPVFCLARRASGLGARAVTLPRAATPVASLAAAAALQGVRVLICSCILGLCGRQHKLLGWGRAKPPQKTQPLG